MEDYRRLRSLMVEMQLVPRGIKDSRVLDAMRKVPRHLFIEESMRYRAYDDSALPVGEEQTISQPYMVAIMTELLGLKGSEKVLEIGTGSGYQAAILAELSGHVYTVERIESLSEKAEDVINRLGYKNVSFMIADGTLGWPEEAPFDRIIVTAGSPELPEPLIYQLSEGGMIVVPVGDRSSQQLVRAEKRNGEVIKEFFTPCIFVPLIGKYAW